jgi:hypothetical protein
MIDVIPDRNPLRELLGAAEMIAVPVRGDEMIDLREGSLGPAAPPFPVSMSTDSPDGATKSVAFPPSTSTT